MSQELSGKVLTENGTPIEGASLFIESKNLHTHSNADGSYSLKGAEEGDSLQVTHLAYSTRHLRIEDPAKSLNVKLEKGELRLDEAVVTSNRHAPSLIGNVDVRTDPVNSSQEVLRRIPGLTIGQHSGGGKAEQLFMRGFDADHGTDIRLSVDGMPVNMVSHAHGHGYSDLHFLIPETIEGIDQGKGPYYVDQGNFATAGYVDLQTKDRLDRSSISIRSGMFNSHRLLGMIDLMNEPRQSAYIASELYLTDGPFEMDQDLQRLNLMGKYHRILSDGGVLTLSASHFGSSWNASGQIPQRAVGNGTISRFGALDEQQGGSTQRSDLKASYAKKVQDNTYLKSRIYYSDYRFELFSNFSYYLNDPKNGDQIRQNEDRRLFGGRTELHHDLSSPFIKGDLRLGVGLRDDRSEKNGLYRTKDRYKVLDTVRLDDIHESDLFAYLDADLSRGDWHVRPGIRIDRFRFNVFDRLKPGADPRSFTAEVLSPKLSVTYDPSRSFRIYLKTGKGFHSNDSRAVVESEDPSGTIPGAYGTDIGSVWKPVSSLLIDLQAWYLYMEDEITYVGDAGILGSSGRTERNGLGIDLRYQPFSWLILSGDLRYTEARPLDPSEGERYIPLAPKWTGRGGVRFQSDSSGWNGGARVRFMGDRPADPRGDYTAEGYSIVDANLGYSWDHLELRAIVENLFNTDWKETQFVRRSRLSNEKRGHRGIHFTPGTPFALKGQISYRF